MPENQYKHIGNADTLRQVVEYLSNVNEEYEEIVATLNGNVFMEKITLQKVPEIQAVINCVDSRLDRVRVLTQEIEDRVGDIEILELTDDIKALQHTFDKRQQMVTALLYDITNKAERFEAPSDGSKVTPAQRPKRPPRNAQFLLYLFLEKRGREEAVGDALEDYSQYIKRVGKLRADILFWQEAGRCAWPFIKRTAAKIGGLIVIGEWIRKLTH
ncbi:MAG TPA: permease prefix domain 2-containing transporter [Pyrinomonadaceae bacterium]|nr:permease prefix domain 2-containing transporter [Pyrinomonadaceae bacterium]